MKPLRGPLRKRESHLWERDPNDFYVEPSWVSRRLFEEEIFRGRIFDPACGGGNIVVSAKAHGYDSDGADIIRRNSHCSWEQDFLQETIEFDNIVCNPPFKLCDDRKAKSHPWVSKCLERAKFKIALLLPANWIQGDARSRWLETTPLFRVWFISPRPSMPPGAAIEAGQKPGNGTTDYAWFVWLQGFEGETTIRWLRRMAT